jgi:hypothetical protein
MFPLTPALQSSEDIENIRLLELQIMLTGLNEGIGSNKTLTTTLTTC